VDEGTQVKKGDLLCELDVTARSKELVALQIRVQGAEAALIFTQENLKITESQGQADVDAAELAQRFADVDLKQYQTGQYPKLLKEAEAKITIAEEELTRAQETLNWSNTLFEEKYISKTALQQDELAMKKAQLAVELAKADLDLLATHTHARSLATFESAVKQTAMAVERTRRKMTANMAQAEADLKAKKALLESERTDLEETEQQIAKAKIHAAIDGMVLYASSVSQEWDDEKPPIKEGVQVDEGGEIIYLPTTGTFNVDTKILEANLRKVRVGHAARVTIDALPGKVFPGKVTRIAPLPDQQSRWMNPNLKLYNTNITIDNPDAALRNGMSCRVEILVDEYPDAVHVPIQCVTRLNGRPTVHLIEGGRAVPHTVDIGLDNGRFVHVLDGLKGGEIVALTPPLSADDVPKSEKHEGENGKPPGGAKPAERPAEKPVAAAEPKP
jgi:HlyD family secretion protein